MLAAERVRLFRLLALTNSPYDGEALAASRMANKLLKRTGTTWVDLFGQDEPIRDAALTEAPPPETDGFSARTRENSDRLNGRRPSMLLGRSYLDLHLKIVVGINLIGEGLIPINQMVAAISVRLWICDIVFLIFDDVSE